MTNSLVYIIFDLVESSIPTNKSQFRCILKFTICWAEKVANYVLFCCPHLSIVCSFRKCIRLLFITYCILRIDSSPYNGFSFITFSLCPFLQNFSLFWEIYQKYRVITKAIENFQNWEFIEGCWRRKFMENFR